ncbi:MAG: hypothetical protein K2U26_11240, partial [Cyclobacteriaceae bacterium]|nr:hypothetical protein [Cyclobacteriaceae bacterium]
MNSLPWKKIALVGAGLAVIVFGVFYYQKVKGKGEAASGFDPAFGEYISSYTTGVVSSGSTLRIVLATDAVDSAAIGETTVKLFDFSPSVQGTTAWLDRRTVEFKPTTRLTSGQVYEVEFALSRLVNVPDNLSVFDYSF